jgi:hypothetical protein
MPNHLIKLPEGWDVKDVNGEQLATNGVATAWYENGEVVIGDAEGFAVLNLSRNDLRKLANYVAEMLMK